MSEIEIILFLWMAATATVIWRVPEKWQLDAMAGSTAMFLATFSSWSCLWLSVSTIFSWLCINRLTQGRRAPTIAVAMIIFLFFLAAKKLAHSANGHITLPLLAGIAYYSCRQVHVLLEAYKGNIGSLSLRRYCQYMFFLPVIFAGPINRLPRFLRQCERRRWETTNLTEGLERILYGYAKIVLGNYLLMVKWAALFPSGEGFFDQLVLSARDWLHLYIQFSGHTDVALGFALLVGFRLEENFNNPLRARNLIDFWMRWHITLSTWCKDYVFAPFQAWTRSQLLAVGMAMVVIGLWHEISLYYLLWGIYHAAGIALCRLYQTADDPLCLARLPALLSATITRGATFAWLIGGRPVLTMAISTTGLN